jgi:coenzyme F420-reducing hydrogenase beta subunit
MQEDKDGFMYPAVDNTVCVNCGKCTKVCPAENPYEKRDSIICYAARNDNSEDLAKSSSGGIFYSLAKHYVETGGHVFGAAFDSKWEVQHVKASSITELKALQGSKYIQSKIGNTFRETEELLKKGEDVLFSGTSCQIAGLKHFLGKEYENLLTVEIICHGVPSSKVWRDYLSEKFPKSEIGNINFRQKRNAKTNLMVIKDPNGKILSSEIYTKNIFINGFLKNLYLRPSCHNCEAKQGKSGSDIALGDFRGIEKHTSDFSDNKGVGAVICYTQKGKEAIDKAKVIKQVFPYETLVERNSPIERSVKPHPKRELFFAEYSRPVSKRINDFTKVSFVQRVINKIKRIIKK